MAKRKQPATVACARPDILLVGLGNPGARYARTRHNAGQMLVHRIVAEHGFGSWKPCNGARVAFGSMGGRNVLAVLPSTHMNNNGHGLAELACNHGCDPSRILVAHDDLDLPCGRLKIKQGGSSGGHKGLDSCGQCLRSVDFWRLRIGIGRPACKEDVPEFVLDPFSERELAALSPLLSSLAGAELGPMLPELCLGGDAARSKLLGALVSAATAKTATAADAKPATAAVPARQTAPAAEVKRRPVLPRLCKSFSGSATDSASAPDTSAEGVAGGDEACEPPSKRQQSWGSGSLAEALPPIRHQSRSSSGRRP